MSYELNIDHSSGMFIYLYKIIYLMNQIQVTKENGRSHARDPFGLDLQVQILETEFGSMMERTYVWTSKHGNPNSPDHQ